MTNLWQSDSGADSQQAPCLKIPRLLGFDPSISAGACSFSTKATAENLFMDSFECCYVSRGVQDLASISVDDFAPLDRSILLRILERDELDDSDWERFGLAALVSPSEGIAPIDALLHAQLPHRHVCFVKAWDILALTLGEDAEDAIQNVYGNRVLYLPYERPGFDLARALRRVLKDCDLNFIDGLIVSKIGLITFDDDAKRTYDKTIQLVTMARDTLESDSPKTPDLPVQEDLVLLAKIRSSVSKTFSRALIAKHDSSNEARSFSRYENGAEYRTLDKSHTTVVVWKNRGFVAFGETSQEAHDASQVALHSFRILDRAKSKGRLGSSPEEEFFGADCRSTHSIKSARSSASPTHQGKIALVTGSAAGIGFACAKALANEGAHVIGLDLNPSITDVMENIGGIGIRVDLTHEHLTKEALDRIVRTYGGLDILVSNAGLFTAGEAIQNLETENWELSMAVNVTSHLRLLKHAIPYLKHGIDPAVVIVGSRNVNAPGAGAASYSCAKAALTQLGRVAALELAEHGVRVNIVHPDAVFDTKLWTPEVLKRSAERYGMSVEEYKSRNLMKTEVLSINVAQMVLAMVGSPFSKTTGAQVPVDGGNDRII